MPGKVQPQRRTVFFGKLVGNEQGVHTDAFQEGILADIRVKPQFFPLLDHVHECLENEGLFLALGGADPKDGGKPLLANLDVVLGKEPVNLA